MKHVLLARVVEVVADVRDVVRERVIVAVRVKVFVVVVVARVVVIPAIGVDIDILAIIIKRLRNCLEQK